MSLPSWRHHSFTRRQRSGRGMSFSSGTRRVASWPRAWMAETMRPARRRFWAYSRRRPSGERLPLVSMPLRLVQSTSSPKKETDNSNNQGKTRVKIREIIGRNPEVTIQEMAKEIGVTPKTIEWHIAKMKGVEIERQGPANGGHWILLKP